MRRIGKKFDRIMVVREKVNFNWTDELILGRIEHQSLSLHDDLNTWMIEYEKNNF